MAAHNIVGMITGDWGEGALTLALLLIMLFTKVALRKLRTDAGKGLDAKRFPHMAKGNGGSCVNPQYNN